MPTNLGAPAPPAAAPLTPPAHSRDVRISAHARRVRGGPFGYVPGGPIFRLPLRFIGATAVGQSSEEAGASSDWVGAPVFGWDTQSRRHRGAGWSGGWPCGSGSPARGCGASAGANPCPARGGGGRPAGTALRVSALNSHVSPGAPWLPAKREWPGAGKSRRAGQGRPGAASLPSGSRAAPNSLFSLFFSPLARPRAHPRSV